VVSKFTDCFYITVRCICVLYFQVYFACDSYSNQHLFPKINTLIRWAKDHCLADFSTFNFSPLYKRIPCHTASNSGCFPFSCSMNFVYSFSSISSDVAEWKYWYVFPSSHESNVILKAGSSSSFPLGSFTLCFRKHLSLMAYCTIPVLDIPTFSTSSALPLPIRRERWSCKPV
jgi:hypothetical protein